MKFIVDVNVLSEATKPAPSPGVITWLREHEQDLSIDAVILGEIRFGILLLPKGKRRTVLEAWFDAGIERLVCLPWDAATALEWASLLAKLRLKGSAMPLKDSMIAASVLRHKLTLVTRNVEDFERVGVPVINPFE